MNIVKTVEEISLPIINELGLILWDVEFKKEGSDFVLRILIDKEEGGISINDCEAVSRRVEVILDEKDLIEQSYCLEVSSAGLVRELKKDVHLEKYLGYTVNVSTYKSIDGLAKKNDAKLLSFNKDSITFEIKDRTVTINRSDISKIKVDLL